MPHATSDHFDGKTFFNPGEESDRGLLDLIKWKLTSRAAPWPERVDVARQPLPPAPAPEGIVATCVGHSTVLLRTASATILTDPIFSERASPVPWAGPRRVAPPGVDFDAMPRVDVVLLSHDHFDHWSSRPWATARCSPARAFGGSSSSTGGRPTPGRRG